MGRGAYHSYSSGSDFEVRQGVIKPVRIRPICSPLLLHEFFQFAMLEFGVGLDQLRWSIAHQAMIVQSGRRRMRRGSGWLSRFPINRGWYAIFTWYVDRSERRVANKSVVVVIRRVLTNR